MRNGILAVGLLLAACDSQSQVVGMPGVEHKNQPRVTAVVADLSGVGVNPYYPEFRRPGWTMHPSKSIPGFPKDAPALPLTLGPDFAANLAADQAAWAAYQPGVVHWVPGTNLLLLTTRSPEGVPGYEGVHTGYVEAGPNAPGHSLQTATVISRTCAECYVLIVQDVENIDGESLQRIASSLPWVDVVQSTSFSGGGSGAYPAATRALRDSGRMFVTGTGNTFVTGVNTYPDINLPPWVFLVGGAQDFDPESGLACNATYADAGRPAEVVGNYAWILPSNTDMTTQYWLTGTSYASPQVAAEFGRVLIGVRRALGDRRAAGAVWAGPAVADTVLDDGRLTGEEVRRVLTSTATLFATQDFNPECAVGTAASFALRNLQIEVPLPVSPTPWVELGWGFVGAGAADLAVDVITGNAPPPAKPAEAARYMDAFMALRRQLYPE